MTMILTVFLAAMDQEPLYARKMCYEFGQQVPHTVLFKHIICLQILFKTNARITSIYRSVV